MSLLCNSLSSSVNFFPLITGKDNSGKSIFAYVNERMQLAQAVSVTLLGKIKILII